MKMKVMISIKRDPNEQTFCEALKPMIKNALSSCKGIDVTLEENDKNLCLVRDVLFGDITDWFEETGINLETE